MENCLFRPAGNLPYGQTDKPQIGPKAGKGTFEKACLWRGLAAFAAGYRDRPKVEPDKDQIAEDFIFRSPFVFSL